MLTSRCLKGEIIVRFFLSKWRLPLILGALTIVVLVGNLLWRESPKVTSLNQEKESIKSAPLVESGNPTVDEGETVSGEDWLGELVEPSQSLPTTYLEVESAQGAVSYEAESQTEGSQAEESEQVETSEIPEGYYLYEGKLYPLVEIRNYRLPDGRTVPLKLVRGKKYRILTSWRNPNPPRRLTPEELRYQEELLEKQRRLYQEIPNTPSEEIRKELIREIIKIGKELENLPSGLCVGWDSVEEIWLRLPGQSEPSEVITIDLRDY
jgi:hypothetical protein